MDFDFTASFGYSLALLTQEVLLSLFVAVFIGASIASGGPIQGFMDMLNKYLVGALTDSWNISILIFASLSAA